MLDRKTKDKVTVTLRLNQLAQATFCFPAGVYLLKATDSLRFHDLLQCHMTADLAKRQ